MPIPQFPPREPGLRQAPSQFTQWLSEPVFSPNLPPQGQMPGVPVPPWQGGPGFFDLLQLPLIPVIAGSPAIGAEFGLSALNSLLGQKIGQRGGELFFGEPGREWGGLIGSLAGVPGFAASASIPSLTNLASKIRNEIRPERAFLSKVADMQLWQERAATAGQVPHPPVWIWGQEGRPRLGFTNSQELMDRIMLASDPLPVSSNALGKFHRALSLVQSRFPHTTSLVRSIDVVPETAMGRGTLAYQTRVPLPESPYASRIVIKPSTIEHSSLPELLDHLTHETFHAAQDRLGAAQHYGRSRWDKFKVERPAYARGDRTKEINKDEWYVPPLPVPSWWK